MTKDSQGESFGNEYDRIVPIDLVPYKDFK